MAHFLSSQWPRAIINQIKVMTLKTFSPPTCQLPYKRKTNTFSLTDDLIMHNSLTKFHKLPLITFILTSLFFCTEALAKDIVKNRMLSYNAELANFHYPFDVLTFQLSSQKQKLNMRYMDVGKSKEKNQKVAVLLHGKNFSGYYWEDVANLLVKQGYRVIIPDQIGFGKSSKPQHYQYSFTQLALNTQSLLKNIGVKKYKVIGHSMGGMLATTLELNDPNVSDLILINPIGLEPYLDYVQIKDPEFFYAMEIKKTE